MNSICHQILYFLNDCQKGGGYQLGAYIFENIFKFRVFKSFLKEMAYPD